MKTRIFGIIVLLSLLVIQTACEKKNLTRDKWKITNAIDLTDQSNITSDYSGEIWEYTKDGSYIENGNLKGTWSFGNKKESLTIVKTNGGSDYFIVLKLKKNEMLLEIPGEEEIQLSRL